MPANSRRAPFMNQDARRYSPLVKMDGRWHMRLSEYLRAHRPEYVHQSGRWKGKINTWRLSEETGVRYDMMLKWIAGDPYRFGMRQMGRLCYALKCLPTDILEWEAFPADPSLRTPVDHERPAVADIGKPTEPESLADDLEEEEYTREYTGFGHGSK